MTGRREILFTSLCVAFILATVNPGAEAAQRGGPARIPVIYSTDLFHPHHDPDDHFDLAAIYAIPELDLKGIILDQGGVDPAGARGEIPVRQMNWLTGRNVRAVRGLSDKLKDGTDKGLEQVRDTQAGVELILSTLEKSDQPVTLITVGSVRDVVAAFNRAPDLLRRKVGRLYVFAGEASENPKNKDHSGGFLEYNVKLDPHAYVTVMHSGLPVYWLPCFDGGRPYINNGHASFWKASHRELLAKSREDLIQFFVYALEKRTDDPIDFLKRPVDQASQKKLFSGERNLWCTAVFTHAADGRIARRNGQYSLRPQGASPTGQETPLFDFSEVELRVNEFGAVIYGKGKSFHKVLRFDILDQEHYADGMTAITAGLLAALPGRRNMQR